MGLNVRSKNPDKQLILNILKFQDANRTQHGPITTVTRNFI